jgi:hypothetical protein
LAADAGDAGGSDEEDDAEGEGPFRVVAVDGRQIIAQRGRQLVALKSPQL